MEIVDSILVSLGINKEKYGWRIILLTYYMLYFSIINVSI